MEPLKVKGHDYLVRDSQTNSIINTNMLEYNEYISRRNSKNEECEKIKNIEEEIDHIKDDLKEIKFLLRNLVDGSR